MNTTFKIRNGYLKCGIEQLDQNSFYTPFFQEEDSSFQPSEKNHQYQEYVPLYG